MQLRSNMCSHLAHADRDVLHMGYSLSFERRAAARRHRWSDAAALIATALARVFTSTMRAENQSLDLIVRSSRRTHLDEYIWSTNHEDCPFRVHTVFPTPAPASMHFPAWTHNFRKSYSNDLSETLHDHEPRVNLISTSRGIKIVLEHDREVLTGDTRIRNLNLRLRRNKTELLKFSGASISDMGGNLVPTESVQCAERAGL